MHANHYPYFGLLLVLDADLDSSVFDDSLCGFGGVISARRKASSLRAITSSSVEVCFWSPMPLELSQLHRVRENSIGSVVAGHLPSVVAKHFGCHLGIAYLSCRSLQHILTDHQDIQLLDILHMPEMIRCGLWIADRPNSACVIYTPPDTDNLHYASGLKVTGGGFEPYMSSFYRIGRRQIVAKRRRGIILREHL